MHDLQVTDDSTLILPLFATPGAECQTAMMVEGIRGMDILEAIISGNSRGDMSLKTWMCLGEIFATQLEAFKSFHPHQVS